MSDRWATATTVTQLLDLRAAASPQAIAFQQESAAGAWQPVNWQAFSSRVATLRRALSAAGLGRGDRLALIAPVSLEWELLHHAALSIGAVVVGLDAHDQPERIADMAGQAGIAAFATADARVLSKLGADRLAAVRLLVRLGTAPGGNGAEWPTGPRTLTWTELQALGAASPSEPAGPSADDLATIIFTSGTTGVPRGIAYSHDQLCLAIHAICDAYSFVGPDSRLLCWLPLSNLFQRIVNLAAVRQGAATYLLPDPRRVMKAVARVSPDIFVGVPRFYEKLYDGLRDNIAAQPWPQRKLAEWAWNLGRQVSRCRRDRRKLPQALALAQAVADRLVLRRIRHVMGDRLHCMVSGSAPMSKHLLEEFHALGWLVLEAYGLSENVLPMAMNRIDAYRFGSVGRPLTGNQIVVADDGAIRVRGPGVFGGYLNDRGAPPFDGDGFYLTGDLGRLDADGFLWLTGRSGDLIKTSTGRRVAPAGVEAVLRQVPGVDQAVLIGNGRKALVALCTCATGLDAAATARLELALHEQLAQVNEHERPLAIALIARPFSIELGELTPNLKLRRAAIEERHVTLIAGLYEEIGALASPPAPATRVI
jgi:long-chain acyl-CoA synthetase